MKVWRVKTEVTLVVVAETREEAMGISADSFGDAQGELDDADVSASEIKSEADLSPGERGMLPWGGDDDERNVEAYFKRETKGGSA